MVQEILLQTDFNLVSGTKISLTAGAPPCEAKHNKRGKKVHIYRFLKIEVLVLIKALR